MRRQLAILLAALLVLLASSLASAEASSVVYYSKTTGAYGWCAGYSYSYGESCAKESCAKYGGADCALATECDGGWTATAFAEPPAAGFGTSCGWTSTLGARAWALISCILSSNTYCHLDQTFDESGNKRSQQEDKAFDQVWQAQVLLDLNGVSAGSYDGKMGPRTRTAIQAFQQKVGLAPTGEVDDEVLALLSDAVGGPSALLNVMHTKPDYVGKIPDYTYSFSGTPRPDHTLGEDLALRSEAQRRMTLAAMIQSADVACSRPARNVAIQSGSKFAGWFVDCAEGNYRVAMDGPGKWTIYNAGADVGASRSTGSDGSHDDGAAAPGSITNSSGEQRN